MAKSLNRVQLIGNLTRDPELRYTPAGTAVVSFSIATNRTRRTDTGETKDEADFHRVVAWDKLAEICGKFLKKGRKCYVEGRLQTRKWENKEGVTQYTTEVVISDMILLDRSGEGTGMGNEDAGDDIPADFDAVADETSVKAQPQQAAEASDDDIPF
jgi:single-strand DNA-binding protein